MDGKLYTQKDGVAMGSPLGVTFANFYMINLENKVFRDQPNLKASIYCRYVYDCFIIDESSHQLNEILTAFKNESVL